MTDEKDGTISKAIGALGTLERATEFQTFLLLANFTFALDLALMLTHRTSVLDLSWQYAKSNLPLGQALAFLTAFTLYMSCIAAILRYFADQIVRFPAVEVGSLLRRLSTTSSLYRRERPRHRVRPSELLDAARTEHDAGYLEQYEAHVNQRGQSRAAAWRTSSLAFALLTLLVADVTLPPGTSLWIVFVSFSNSLASGLGNILGAAVIFILVVVWTLRFLEDDFDDDWVVCPRLYDKLMAERLAEEAEVRDAKVALRRSV